jgi:hypothetical protein
MVAETNNSPSSMGKVLCHRFHIGPVQRLNHASKMEQQGLLARQPASLIAAGLIALQRWRHQ